VVICLFFMVFFQRNIRALIDRTKRVKYGHAEVQTDNPSQEPIDTTANSAENLTKALGNNSSHRSAEMLARDNSE